jgi:cell division protein ZapA (FtsZ GTPase activity inhibitor)
MTAVRAEKLRSVRLAAILRHRRLRFERFSENILLQCFRGNEMKLRKLVMLLAGAALAMICASAMAQSAGPLGDGQLQAIAGMFAELHAEKGEEAKHTQLIAQADELAAPKIKEMKIYGDQQPAFKAAYTALDKETEVNEAEGDKHRAALNAHKAGCPAHTTSQAVVARCNGEVGPLNAWADRVNHKREDIHRRAAELDKKRDSIVARLNVLKGELEQLADQKRASTQRLEQARNRIAALTSRLSAMCTSIPTGSSIEEIKLKCGNVDFDGARSTLAPCDTDKCKEYDRLTHRP